MNDGLRQGGTSTLGRRLASVAPAILIVVLALAYWQTRMVPAVPRPDRIERWSADLYESYLPVWTFAYAGPWLVPRWNPFQLAGSPLLASVTGAPAYPLNLLATIVPVPIALGWACALHVALAGVLMFLCGRAAGLSRAAARLAAIGFMLSERVLIERIHPPYLFGVAWLPAVFLAAGRVGSEPGAWRGAVLGAAVACLLLAGYPELVCFTAYSLLLLLLVFLVIRGVPAWSDLRRLMVAGIAAVATACALAAVQLLPTLELAGEAVRSLKSLPLDQILAVPPPPWEASFSCRGRSSASRSPPSPVAGTFRSSSSAPCSSSSPVRSAS
ncbi:MAG TPA: hypothetical protein VKH82_15265 [Candidatus Binatia bacterium]|nr:hypothetical protein [Candidatus Binatia bacterium]